MPNLPTTTATRQFAGLVLARVEPSKLDELRELLNQIGAQTTAAMKGHVVSEPLIPFGKLETIHYARIVLLDRDAELGPMLAFSTNYDGPEGEDTCSESLALDRHLDELVAHAGPGLESVFALCCGYRAGQLRSFLRKHRKPASTFYVGSSGRSRNQILWEAELRRHVDRVLDAETFAGMSPELVRASVAERLRATYATIPTFPPQPDLTARVNAARAAAAAVAFAVVAAVTVLFGFAGFLVLTAVVALAVLRFRWLELHDPQFQPEYSERTRERFALASARENEFLQNQLTHMVRVKPGPIRWVVLRAVFLFLDILAKNAFNHGKLGGIPSIHFARWVLLPKGRVLFFSNFDSSWQSYLGDFIDQASSGLTAVWSNTRGYPRTRWLLRAGSRDAARFLAWTRHHQHPTQVWYAAYPGLSIVNVNANTEIRRGLADPDAVDATSWLFRLRGVDSRAADAQFGDERRQPPLPMKEIQGIILWGYGHVPEARYLMFRVKELGQPLLDWIAGLPLTSADGGKTSEPSDPLNIAFTYRGLRALGVDPGLCERFSTPFVQGSDDPYRARVNGDVGVDAPEQWRWGASHNPVDLVLLSFAKDVSRLNERVEALTREATAVGLELVASLEGTTLPDRKEHFGFRDGIAQPTVQGSGRGEIEGNTVAAGEFLLGHRDGYGNVSHSPESPAGFAFGRNGSYLVFRQLEQDVPAFWRYCESQGLGAVNVASKLVGRWPSGASLVRHPEGDPEQARFADEDAFTYLENGEDNDRYGARCPFGAHVRRTNPRDWQLGGSVTESLTLSNLHRILRRGRPYGPPLAPSMAARALLERSVRGTRGDTAGERGLQFLCFNANLDRQFEFVQQQWANNPKFAGGNSDADALLGMHQPNGEVGTDAPVFTLQSDVKAGLLPRLTGMQRFVRVVGSSYFFMPSIPAVKLLRGEVCRPSAAAALEVVPPDEQLHIDSLIDSLRERMKQDYLGKQTLRDAHPKMHGVVRAVFRVEPGLDPKLRVGLFAEPREYRAWARFSNASGTVQDDRERDIRGCAIKLLDVPGAKLLEGSEDCRTHDLLLVSADAFVVPDVAGFDALVRALFGGTLGKLAFFAKHPKAVARLLATLKKHRDLLDIQYFSIVPYLFGTEAVKYSLRPTANGAPAAAVEEGPEQLREALEARLGRGPVSFEFLVQLPEDSRGFPIEDAQVPWRGPRAPFHKVATLEILEQEFDTPEQRRFGENLSYNPWRCLPEHRPLGGISRARRQVYRTLSGFRHDRNAAPNEEPSVW